MSPLLEWSTLIPSQKVELLDKLIKKELMSELRLLLLFIQLMEQHAAKNNPQHFEKVEELMCDKLLDMAKKLKDVVRITNQV
jgi:hypothetical protein